LLSFALGTIGCGEALPEIGQHEQALIAGDPSPAGTEDDAVLLLRATADGELICTATLVAPNLAVSARHCVAYGGPPQFQCTVEGELVPNSFGGGTLGADYPPGSVELYTVDDRSAPVALVSQVISTLTETICKNDVAFLLLDRDVDLPVRAIRLETPTLKSERLELVGYGATAPGEELDFKTLQRTRLDDRGIFDVGPDTSDGLIFVAPPRTFVIEGPASCSGDSGGPAFSEESGAVIGVFSILGEGNCSASGIDLYYTQTGPFFTLAQQAFEVAGHPPLREPGSTGAEPEPPSPDGGVSSPPQEPDEDTGCHLRGHTERRDVFVFMLAFALVSLLRRRDRKECK
jgi:hypothetical protein